jgi:hypothetical protein
MIRPQAKPHAPEAAVARTGTHPHPAPRAEDPYAQTDELLPAVQSALAALADLETRYEIERERLDGWRGPKAAKERLAAALRERYRADRRTFVEQLEMLQRMLLTRQPRVLH